MRSLVMRVFVIPSLTVLVFTAAFALIHLPAMAQDSTKAASEQKRLTVKFEKQPWSKVLEWLSDQTGLPVIISSTPTGTFTAALPPGAKVTVAEAIDLINEGLLPSKFRLLRRANSLTLVPADERIDPALVPATALEDLGRHGRTEVVRVTLAVKTVKAATLLPEIKKLLSPFGDAATLGQRLVLTDAAGNLIRIVQLVRDLDQPADAEPPAARTEVLPLSTLQAERVVETLKGMFGGKSGLFLEADPRRNALVVRGAPEQIRQVSDALRALGETPPQGNLRIIMVERGSALVLAEAIQGMLKDMRANPVQIVAPGRKPEPAPPAKKPGADAKEAPALTLTVVGNKLMASCADAQVLALVQDLARLLAQAVGEGEFEVIQLRHSSAADVAKMLQDSFNADPQAARIRVIPDPVSNAILVRGTPLDLLTIRRLLRTALDIERPDTDAEMRVTILGPFKNASAADLAKLLRELYRGEGEPVRVVLALAADPRTNTLVLRCAPVLGREIQTLVQQLDSMTPPKQAATR
jgi:type II secretory pathway component GspD/PulD (secretin)